MDTPLKTNSQPQFVCPRLGQRGLPRRAVAKGAVGVPHGAETRVHLANSLLGSKLRVGPVKEPAGLEPRVLAAILRLAVAERPSSARRVLLALRDAGVLGGGVNDLRSNIYCTINCVLFGAKRPAIQRPRPD